MPTASWTLGLGTLVSGVPPLVFAVGDGNHSLATAKTCYENLKKVTPFQPRRWPPFIISSKSYTCSMEPAAARMGSMQVFLARDGQGVGHTIAYTWAGGSGYLNVPNPRVQLAVGTLQNFLDAYLKGLCEAIEKPL